MTSGKSRVLSLDRPYKSARRLVYGNYSSGHMT